MLVQSSTHTSLLARLADRADMTAWREFHSRYGELISNFARRRGLQPADCDDVVQEVLLSLSKALPGFRYDPSRGKFRSFLKTVAINVMIDRKRRQRGETNLASYGEACAAVDDPETEQAWEKEWRQYHLRQALCKIEVEFGDTDRRAFKFYALDCRDARETAETLGMSVDQVYQAKSRITRRLSMLIEMQVQEEG